MSKTIPEQIAELKQAQETFSRQATFELGAFAGKIALLEAQLAEQDAPNKEPRPKLVKDVKVP